MINQPLCANLIAWFEGFQARAYWDVNAWRVGFGSDTQDADQTPVHKGDSTTYELALANLSARLPHYEQTIINQIGEAAWARFPANGQAALMDFAYNYGSLTSTLALDAARFLVRACALDLAARSGDNGGVNATRRHVEAAFMASVE
jgi:GH24 family phage-related lysozyme (muramidase)